MLIFSLCAHRSSGLQLSQLDNGVRRVIFMMVATTFRTRSDDVVTSLSASIAHTEARTQYIETVQRELSSSGESAEVLLWCLERWCSLDPEPCGGVLFQALLTAGCQPLQRLLFSFLLKVRGLIFLKFCGFSIKNESVCVVYELCECVCVCLSQ